MESRSSKTTECPDCGNIYTTDSKFCRKCGKPRSDGAESTAGYQSTHVFMEPIAEPFEFKQSYTSTTVGTAPIDEIPTTSLPKNIEPATIFPIEAERLLTPTTRGSSIPFNEFDSADRSMGSVTPVTIATNSNLVNTHQSLLTTSDIARQHYEWSSELETVDQKQADLMMVQWKMIRDQTGMLAQQLIELKKELENVKHLSLGTSVRLDQYMNDNKGMEVRIEKSLRHNHEKLADDLSKLRLSFAAEMQQRQNQDADMLNRLGALESSIESSLPKLNRDVGELRELVEAPTKQVRKLKTQVDQHVEEWKNGHLMAIEHSTKLHDGLNKGLRELMVVFENHKNDVQQGLTQQWGNFDRALDQVREHFNTRIGEINANRGEDPQVRSRLQDIEDKILALARDIPRSIDAKLRDKEAQFVELQTSLEQLTAHLAQECQARQALAEEMDQMLKAERTKLINMMQQKAACARLDCKEVQKTLTDLLTKETADRQDADASNKQEYMGLYESLGNRLGSFEGTFHGLEQSCFVTQTHVRNFETQLDKVKSSLEPRVEALRVELRNLLDKERLERELADATLVEQVEFLEAFHKHMREFYMLRGNPPQPSA